MSDLVLHPKKGLNPHLGLCPRCGKESGEILLLGIRDRKITCPDCGTVNYGSRISEKCGRCGSPLANGTAEAIEETEKIPAGLCKECQEKQKAVDEMVAKGGVYFRCKKCGSQGALVSGHPFSALVREKLKIKAPGKCGAELDECPQCREANT